MGTDVFVLALSFVIQPTVGKERCWGRLVYVLFKSAFQEKGIAFFSSFLAEAPGREATSKRL